MMGLAAIKAGYRDEKEDMSGKNIEVSVITESGFRTLGEQEIGEYMTNLGDFKPE